MAKVNPIIVGHIPKGKKSPTGLPWHHLPRNACYRQNFSHPCYFEYSHIRHLSCFTSEMFTSESCCSVGLCDGCLHHSYPLDPFFHFFHWSVTKVLKTIVMCCFVSWVLYIAMIFTGMKRHRAKRFAIRFVFILLFLIFLLSVIVRFQYYRNKRRNS